MYLAIIIALILFVLVLIAALIGKHQERNALEHKLLLEQVISNGLTDDVEKQTDRLADANRSIRLLTMDLQHAKSTIANMEIAANLLDKELVEARAAYLTATFDATLLEIEQHAQADLPIPFSVVDRPVFDIDCGI